MDLKSIMSNRPVQTRQSSWWHPGLYLRKIPMLQTRQKLKKALRDYFMALGFHEVDTPALQISPGLEVHLHAFKTELGDPHNDRKQTLYLHTSPEFTMKKLLVAGIPRLYQLCHVYRNNERSSTHHPEFMMLEWYRADSSYEDLMADCVGLIRACATAGGMTKFAFGTTACDPFLDWETLTVAEAFQRYCGIDLLATMPSPHTGDAEKLREDAVRIGLRTSGDDSWDNMFFRILTQKIEPNLGQERPTFLADYPVSHAALARPKPGEPRLAERFELYICGLELANGFGELTDPAEQRKRFEADMDAKARLYGERYPIDEDFMAALTFGMPPSAGIALGFDRLAMLCGGATEITDILWAPVAG